MRRLHAAAVAMVGRQEAANKAGVMWGHYRRAGMGLRQLPGNECVEELRDEGWGVAVQPWVNGLHPQRGEQHHPKGEVRRDRRCSSPSGSCDQARGSPMPAVPECKYNCPQEYVQTGRRGSRAS